MWTLLILLAAGAGGCSPQQANLANRAIWYGSYTATDVRASDVFCGNRRKDGVCLSNSQDPNGVGLPAREHVEIRGWIVGTGEFKDAENDQNVNEEYPFSVLLDFGWTPASPAAENLQPINTLQQISSAITPHNAISFGVGPQGIGSTLLDPAGRIWGGRGSLVIHVEVNGWFPAGTPRDRRMHGRRQPDDWIPLAATPGVFWPFDPENPPGIGSGILKLGDYVRVVGTLWEDAAHHESGGTGGDRGEDAKGCWCSGTTGDCEDAAGRGYFEIHPVDYMARIDPPAQSPATVEMISICDSASIVREISPPGPRPAQAVGIDFEKILDPAFTVHRSIRRDEAAIVGDKLRVEVAVETGGPFGHGAKYKALYRVFWRDASGAPVAGPAHVDLPQYVRLLNDPPEEDDCDASLQVREQPRVFIEKGQLAIFRARPPIEWVCSSAPNDVERTDCPAGTTTVRIIRSQEGDEFTTECFGP
jgi:hypothetical protein